VAWCVGGHMSITLQLLSSRSQVNPDT
jgi:hypothetical protein